MRTLVEDWPGRVGYFDRGIPESGPMDHFAHRAANLIVGNPVGEATLEVTAGLLELQFTEDTVISVTGAEMAPTINGQEVRMWESLRVSKGDRLKLRIARGLGMVAYVGFAGGIDVPLLLGSKSTCSNGGFGGFKGRRLEDGDELRLGRPQRSLGALENRKFRRDLIPRYSSVWEVRAIPGPQTSPDYFTEEGMQMWFSEAFEIDSNSSRSAYRLRHRQPLFARKVGSQGAHPSNVVQQPYSPGTLNICGDVATILFVDGVSLGGFVCALTTIRADWWKIGQARPVENKTKFVECTVEEARDARVKQDAIFTEDSLE